MSDALILGLATLVTSIITPLLVLWVNHKLEKVHKQINSRMDEMLAMNKRESKAEGKLEEKAEQKAKEKNKKP